MSISAENRHTNITQELLDEKMNLSYEQEDWEKLVICWEHTKVQSNPQLRQMILLTYISTAGTMGRLICDEEHTRIV
jgi:hypothetical protein